jgi:hypothetical protein
MARLLFDFLETGLITLHFCFEAGDPSDQELSQQAGRQRL